jgi:hypothetical protein
MRLAAYSRAKRGSTDMGASVRDKDTANCSILDAGPAKALRLV